MARRPSGTGGSRRREAARTAVSLELAGSRCKGTRGMGTARQRAAAYAPIFRKKHYHTHQIRSVGSLAPENTSPAGGPCQPARHASGFCPPPSYLSPGVPGEAGFGRGLRACFRSSRLLVAREPGNAAEWQSATTLRLRSQSNSREVINSLWHPPDSSLLPKYSRRKVRHRGYG